MVNCLFICNFQILSFLATTANVDDAEDAAGAGKESYVHPSRGAAPSEGHGQSTGGAEASCLTARQHACNDQSSRTWRGTPVT